MAAFIGLAVGLILAGLLIAWIAPQAVKGVAGVVFYWVGLVLAVIGVVLLITPALVWISAQLRQMLGV